MQEQRSTVGSLPESISFDYGSTSTNVGIDRPIRWNSLHQPDEGGFSEYRTAPGGTNSIMGSESREMQNLSRWNSHGQSSSNLQELMNYEERMTQNGWSSSVTTPTGAASIVSRNGVNLNLNSDQAANSTSILRPSNSHSVSQSPDINAEQLALASPDLMDCNSSKPSDSYEHFASSSGTAGFLVEEDNRRLSCKRKNIEGNTGQPSSYVGSSSMEDAAPPHPGSSSLSISPQLETSLGLGTPDQVNPRFRLSMGVVPPSGRGRPESSRRNYRVRMNQMMQQSPNNSVLPQVQPLRPVPASPPIELIPSIQPEPVGPQGQPVIARPPGSRRNTHIVRGSRASSSRARSSSMSEEREAPLNEDLNSIPVPRNISEHPLFMPSAHNPTGWNLNGIGLGASRHSGSGSHRQTSSQYTRRLSEYVRRSLLSSSGPESGLHNSSTSTHHVASSSQDLVPPPSDGSQGRDLPFSTSALWMDRHGDGAVGIPHSMRSLAAGDQGRSRLVSEQIRSVLDMMRRGEGLRFEDVMILDPSLIFGMADIHDQHRDMRLDVDNMSYEELLALEERIGSVSTGLSEETISARMKQRRYLSLMNDDQTETEPCCICQEEFKDGEDMGVLDCGHDFHTGCIKQWLAQKNSCPICKITGLAP